MAIEGWCLVAVSRSVGQRQGRENTLLNRSTEVDMTHKDMAELRQRLLPMYSVAEANIWFYSEHKLLGNRRPIQCSRGEVMRLIEQLETGAYV
jgi:hypothetical protein